MLRELIQPRSQRESGLRRWDFPQPSIHLLYHVCTVFSLILGGKSCVRPASARVGTRARVTRNPSLPKGKPKNGRGGDSDGNATVIPEKM